ncbi:MAG TPA: DUF6600 domain-containing protein [Thermoanaerobaculia bacterium]|nr:DUF6600 domain-containing protein [Thermoanaerobaculia bacterium]
MKKFCGTTLFLGALGVLAASTARAQGPPGNGGVQQSVARVSYLSGDVSYNRGDQPDVWEDAAVNVPMSIGDRLYLRGEGRAELQLEGRNFVRLGAQSDLSVLNLTDGVDQFSLQAGTASFRLARLGAQESFEVDTPNVAVTFERAGDYRLDVDADGNTRVGVRRGQALVAAGGGQVPLSAGSEMDITGIDSPQYDVVALRGVDAWDRWVDQRGAHRRGDSYRYVNAGVVGAEDLDEYGQWSDIPEYGHVWSPARVEVGWQPYRSGRWGWQDPWGWTWIAEEPWGWAPYHYGRWVNHSSRWFWVPVAPGVAFASYSPALVAFVGGGPGWSASFSIGGGGGYMGWFPLGPRDPFVPWWGSHDGDYGHAGGYGNVTNVNYVNRNYVTVVNQNTFVSGGSVSGNYVRDASVIRQVEAAPVLHGALPVMPTAGALRVSRNAAAAARPPVQVSSRAVVTRLAPPPSPPSFQSKVAAIREQRGAPVTAAAAARISIQSNQGARAIQPIRPAAAPSGAVTFSPKSAAAPRPQAVTAPRGKVLATPDRPIVATPAAAARPEVPAPSRIAPNAVASPRPGAGTGARATQQPLAPRGQSAPSQDRQTNVPPKRTFGTPPPSRDNNRPAVQQGRSPEPLAPRGQVAPSQDRQTNAPPKRTSGTPPSSQDNNRPAVQQGRSQQPLAPRGEGAPSQDRQTNAPPKRTSGTPPPSSPESNRPAVQQRTSPPPSAPRGQSAQPTDRQRPAPPKRSVEPPPPTRPDNNRQAAPERRPTPQAGSESRPTPNVNRSAPPPPRQSASPGGKTTERKKPDTKKQKGEPTTSTEPPPQTR